jgi:hypothetical protein
MPDLYATPAFFSALGTMLYSSESTRLSKQSAPPKENDQARKTCLDIGSVLSPVARDAGFCISDAKSQTSHALPANSNGCRTFAAISCLTFSWVGLRALQDESPAPALTLSSSVLTAQLASSRAWHLYLRFLLGRVASTSPPSLSLWISYSPSSPLITLQWLPHLPPDTPQGGHPRAGVESPTGY